MGTTFAASSRPSISLRKNLIFSIRRRKVVRIAIKIVIKMVPSLIVVLLVAVAGTQAEKVTSTGVDLEPIFLFLDDDGSNTISMGELKALTTTGDADGNGEVTAAEFQSAWADIAVQFNVPAEKHAKHFKLVDGVDGSAEDGKIVEAENVALFGRFDKDGSGGIDLDEFFNTISGVIN